jgi:zinc protease
VSARPKETPRPGRPQSAPNRPYRFPQFERRKLDNGAQLIVAPVKKLPIATAAIIVDAGAIADPAGREGIASLTADLLLEGTAKIPGAELIERFEQLGAALEVETSWDVSVISLTALSKHLGPAVRLLGEMLREPAFPAREVDRLKSERHTELMARRSEPRELADVMFSRVLYAGASRYARPAGGTEASIAAITAEDVRKFYEQRYRAGGITMVIVGDVDANAAEDMARAAMSGVTGGAPTKASAEITIARTTRAVHLVTKPEAQQAELRIGHSGLPRAHPDYFAVTVMNAVLGGLFSSRINLNLREKHGYTYGASSLYEWRRQAGPFTVSTAVQTEVTSKAAAEVISEIDRIRNAEIEADELSLVTSYLDGLFPIRFETTESIAAALVNMTTFGLPDDYHDTYRDRVRATTVADVLAAARKHLHPETLQMLVVGDVSQVRPQLETLGFGPLTVYEPSDLP